MDIKFIFLFIFIFSLSLISSKPLYCNPNLVGGQNCQVSTSSIFTNNTYNNITNIYNLFDQSLNTTNSPNFTNLYTGIIYDRNNPNNYINFLTQTFQLDTGLRWTIPRIDGIIELCGSGNCYSLAELNTTGGTGSINYTNVAFTNQTNVFTQSQIIPNVCYSNGTQAYTFNLTYNNILNQDCPAGQVVNGTYSNGTFKCTSVSGSVNWNDIIDKPAWIISVNYTAKENKSYTKFYAGNLTYNISDSNFVAIWGFNNLSGENATYFKDEGGRYNATCTTTTCPIYNYTNSKINASLMFDGIDDYIDTTYKLNNQNITYSAWVYVRGSPSSANGGFIFDSRDAGSDGCALYIWNSPPVSWFWGCNSTGTSFAFSTLNQWYHVVGTFNGTTYELYLNGMRINITTGGATISTITNTRIGARSFTSPLNYLNATLDELRIYNRTLSSTEIMNLYQMGAYHNYTVGNSSEIINYTTNNTINFGNDTVLYAHDFIMNSRVFSGDALKILRNIKTIQTTSKFADIDYTNSLFLERETLGTSFLLKANIQLTQENDALKTQLSDMQKELCTFNKYSWCKT